MTLAFLLAASLAASPPLLAPDAAYTLTLNPTDPSVTVTLAVAAWGDGPTEFAVDEKWGGISGHGIEITEITATDAAGAPLELTRLSDHSWSVKHSPGERLSISYVLREPTDRAPLNGNNDYRTLVRPGLFNMIGNLGLLHPTHLGDAAPSTYTVTWSGFEEEGWRTVSSFGHGPGPTRVTISPDRFRQSLFLAGDLRIRERTMRSTRVAFAVHGDWSFGDEQFVDLATRIISAERGFFDDFSDPFFLVSLIPVKASGSFSLGGTGLTNCFALFCSADMTLGPGSAHDSQVKRLLAHEYFHTWIGGKIRIDAPEGAAYWFTEGFTDFYARRLLLRTRLYSPEEFTKDLNLSLSGYDTSPVKDAPNDRITREFWKSRKIGDLPYRRGDLIALAIDEKMRQTAGGGAGLDGLMRDLLRRTASGEPHISMDGLFALLQDRTSPEFVVSIRRSIIDGADVPLPERVSEPPLVLGSGTSRVFDPGFDFEASKLSRKIVGVRDGSEAHRAGLRDGQTMLGYSITPASGDQPPFAEIKIDDNGAASTISYEALSPPITVRQYKPADR